MDVIYKIECKCCDKNYIGHTNINIKTSIYNHKNVVKRNAKTN